MTEEREKMSAFARSRRRWGDNDHYFGPLTYARDSRHYRPLAVILASGCDEYPGASLRISGFGHTVILALPQWVLRPYREKVHTKSWDAATIKRLGRDWYWDISRREYGFTLSEGHLSVPLGRQTMDSSTEQRWGCFLTRLRSGGTARRRADVRWSDPVMTPADRQASQDESAAREAQREAAERAERERIPRALERMAVALEIIAKAAPILATRHPTREDGDSDG